MFTSLYFVPAYAASDLNESKLDHGQRVLTSNPYGKVADVWEMGFFTGCVRIRWMNKFPGLILASNSPRRKQLLSLTGLDFQVQPADLDETMLPAEHPWDHVLRLARGKAKEAVQIVAGSGFFLAADTIVVDADAILGKPADQLEAASMLKGLRGHTHQVYTGMALCSASGSQETTDICIVDVPIRNFSDEDLSVYVASGDPLDKAGAYAIQHEGFQPVGDLQGCYAGVMGLSLCHLVRMFRRLEVKLNEDIPSRCQAELAYDCPVWQDILNDRELMEKSPPRAGSKGWE
ncbi:Maf family protein [Chloroflexota bacterium]